MTVDDGAGVLDGSGRLRRTAGVTARLHALVEQEPSLARLLAPVPEPMSWGTAGVWFAGRWSQPDVDVLLKLGVSQTQRFWSETIADRDPGLAPRVFAAGARLGGVELGWVLLERLPGGLHGGWGGVEFGLLMDAGVRFQKVARTVEEAPAAELTASAVRAWLTAGAARGAPGPVGEVVQRFPEHWRFLHRVCGTEICHGDLHMANVLMRTPAPELSPALLIDFEPCRMPWVFDAAYPQVLNSDPGRAGWRDMAAQMADRRRAHGLPVCSAQDLERASTIACAWYALRMWGLLGPTPDAAWREAPVWFEQNRAYIAAAAEL